MLTVYTKNLIEMALEEDLGDGDITTTPLLPVLGRGKFTFVANEEFMLAGTEIVGEVFKTVDATLEVSFKYRDGDVVPQGAHFGTVSGKVGSVLMAERVALNFLQRLSAIATHTFSLTSAMLGTGIKIIDTRKTTAGWRSIEKYAVRVGGGTNHRYGLYDAVVIKANHIDAAGGIDAAVSLVRAKAPISCKIEVEVRNLQEVQNALDARADIILMHSDMDLESVVKACGIIDKKAKVELVGDFSKNAISMYKKLPVDYVSVGTLINNAGSADITLKLTTKIKE